MSRTVIETGTPELQPLPGLSTARRPPRVYLLAACLIFVLAGLPFLGALNNGFVNWDDDSNFLENPSYRDLSPSSLRWMATTFQGGHYQPLSWLTLAVDFQLGGLRPFGYHFTNIVLHATGAVVFFFLLLALLPRILAAEPRLGFLTLGAAAAAGTLFFAIHPLRVESVVWATERRDVLCGIFFLLSLLCYLHSQHHESSRRPEQRRWWSFSLVFFALAILSKATAVTLPAALLILDVYPLKRARWGPPWAQWKRLILEKVPFLVLSFLFSILAVWAQYRSAAMSALIDHSIVARLAQAAYGLVFYIWKTLLPLELSPLYEIPRRLDPLEFRFVMSLFLVAAFSILCWRWRDRWPFAPAAWLYYIVLLSPVLGVFQSGPQLVADRYSYLACLPLAVLLSAGALSFLQGLGSGRFRRSELYSVAALALVVVLVLGSLTRQQVHLWKDSVTLWRHALRLNPDNYRAHYNLAVALDDRGYFEAAIEEKLACIRLRPDDTETRMALSRSLFERDRFAEAGEQLLEILRIRSDHTDALYSLGLIAQRLGRYSEAESYYRRALTVEPRQVAASFQLGNVFQLQGRIEEAAGQWESTLELDPAHLQAHQNLGWLALQQNRLEPAEEHFRFMLAADPGNARVIIDLADIRERQERKKKVHSVVPGPESVPSLLSPTGPKGKE